MKRIAIPLMIALIALVTSAAAEDKRTPPPYLGALTGQEAVFSQAADANPPATAGAERTSEGQGSVNELSNKATDPTASLMALNFQGIYNDFHGPSVPGEPDERWTLQFRPVIPFKVFDQPNILRLTVPYQVSGRGDEGWGPITLFDLVVFNEQWGRWGVGPVMSFDTTGDAPDEFVIGPAVGGVWQVTKKLLLGAFSQNVFGSDTAVSQLQPVIAYQLGQGWSLSAGDLQVTYDWEGGRWVDVPIGFQLGKVTKLGRLPVRFSVNPQYNLLNDRGLSEWSVTFTFTALFPSF
ncbi:MAG: hypothetical protein ACREYC_06430 [Gammaproteobacteria bacterium]